MKNIRLFILTLLLFGIHNIYCQVPTDGLIASYPFNGNANDESGNGHNGAVNGSVLIEDRFGNINGAYKFDGIDDYILVNDHDDFSFTDHTFTISFWIYRNPSSVDRMGVMSKRRFDGLDASNWEYNFQTFNNSTTLAFHLFNSQGNCGVYEGGEPDTLFNSLEWIHYTLVGNESFVRLYKNGELYSEGSKSISCNFSNRTGPLVFGKGGGWNENVFLDGYLDDINLYNRALTEEEVAQLYGDFHNSQNASSSANNFNKSYFNVEIVGEDEGCIGQESNYELNINTNQNSYFDPNFASGRVTQYNPLVFDYDGLEVQNTFSFDFWVKPSSSITMKGESGVCYGSVSVPLANSGQNWAVYPGHVNPNFGVGITVGTNGIMIAEHSGNILVSRLSHSISINDWTHVGVVYNTDSLCLYLNGSLVGTRTMHCSSNPKFAPSSIAGALYSSKYQGSIDEFRLWDKALTTAEVADLKDKKLVSEVPNLRYYVSFDNGYYIKALGDLGKDSIAIADDIGVDQLTQSTWDLTPYTGDDITSLAPFTMESLDYLWSTGSADKNISYDPNSGVNELTAQAYNEYLTISDTLNVIGEDCGLETSGKRYLRFRSYYSEDNSQVNVYEIQAYKEGVNVALNKSTYANSHEFGDNDPNAVDGNNGSRWSSNRNDPGPDADNPHFIVVDLQQGYDLDSIILNIEGFDSWEQTFDFAISSDSVNWEIIGSGESTTGIFTYLVDDNLSPDLQFIMSQESVGAGQNIQIPVYVNGFQNILTTQFTITWDPSVVQFKNVQDFGLPFLDAGSFYLIEPGKLTFSWSPDDLQPVSLEDESAIFNIIFTAIGEPGEATDIIFSDDPTVREVSDAENQVLEAAYNNGQISILDEVTLGGYIKTQKKEPIVGIDVELIGGMEMTATTDETGWYEFKVPPNQEYHIAPLFDTEDDDGVTTLDIVIMHWHILGKKYMMSNIDLIASDVNGSGSLTTLDLAETRSVVLHNEGEKFRGKNSVEFVNDEYTGDVDVFEYKNYLDITPTISHLNLNFTAVKRGDASRSWNPNKKPNGRFENLEEIEILLEKKFITENRVFIPLRIYEFSGLVGLQFTFEWDPHVYQFSKLNDGFLHFESNLSKIEVGKLTVSWNTHELEGVSLNSEEIISDIEFIKIIDGDPQLGINSTITPALAFNNSMESFRVTSSEVSNEIIDSKLTIYPNPAEDNIFINLGNNEHYNYSIITATGSVLMTGPISDDNEINISDLRKGVYILQLTDQNQFSINRKFIKQ